MLRCWLDACRRGLWWVWGLFVMTWAGCGCDEGCGVARACVMG